VKLIGLLGGMSWESSIVHERILNEEARRRLGGLHSANLLLRSYDFAVVEQLQPAGEWEQAGRLLADGARKLEAAGAEMLDRARTSS
jgi:aspartate racemase